MQTQILNVLLDLQQRLGLSMLLVSHDLRVVRHHLGIRWRRVVEIGDADAVFDAPMHRWRFHRAACFTRGAPVAFDRCRAEARRLYMRAEWHSAECHLAGDSTPSAQ